MIVAGTEATVVIVATVAVEAGVDVVVAVVAAIGAADPLERT